MAVKSIDISPSANSATRTLVSRFVVFCNPERERAQLFSHNCTCTLGISPVFIPWTRVIAGEIPWEQWSKRDVVFRVESPGKNWLVEKELLKIGARELDVDRPAMWRQLTPGQASAIENDPGRVWPIRTWFLGFRSVLTRMAKAAGPHARWMNSPQNVVAMFDKSETDLRLAAAGATVPQSLGIPVCFDDLLARMQAAARSRVFIKPCHGSSASGVVAFEMSGSKMQAWSTLELVNRDGELQLYNDRRIRRYVGAREVAPLIDAVCGERAVAQVWWPKAGWRGKRFDLRVVVIGGRARHVVPRLSPHPMTNLQVGAERGNPDDLRRDAGEENWARMLAECELATTAFPGNLYCTFDVLVSPGWRNFAIAEANAFGDLLNGSRDDGKDPYGAQLEFYLSRYGR
jgi:hypothetical protein